MCKGFTWKQFITISICLQFHVSVGHSPVLPSPAHETRPPAQAADTGHLPLPVLAGVVRPFWGEDPPQVGGSIRQPQATLQSTNEAMIKHNETKLYIKLD